MTTFCEVCEADRTPALRLSNVNALIKTFSLVL